MEQNYIDICVAGNYISSISQFKDLIKKLFSGNWTKDNLQEIQELIQLTRIGRIKDWIESFENIDEKIGSLSRKIKCAKDLSDDEILCELADSSGIKDKFCEAKASLISLAASNTEKRNGSVLFTFKFNVFYKCNLNEEFSFVVKRKGYDDEVHKQTHNLLIDGFELAFIVSEFTQAEYFLFIEGVDSPIWKNADEKKSVPLSKVDSPFCIHKYADGIYLGEWIGEKRHGKGIMEFVNSKKYEGYWVDDKRTGKGVYIWPNGGRYEGDWVDGKMTGKGDRTWPDGDRHVGLFKNDYPNGYGTCFYSDGRIKKGFG